MEDAAVAEALVEALTDTTAVDTTVVEDAAIVDATAAATTEVAADGTVATTIGAVSGDTVVLSDGTTAVLA